MTFTAQRIDKFLWCARFVKSRSLAARLASSGKIRRNGQRLKKPSQLVRPDDVLTFVLNDDVRVVRVNGFAERRGPYSKAVLLYEDLSPPEPAGKKKSVNRPSALAWRPPGAGRPTKKERRVTESLKGKPF